MNAPLGHLGNRVSALLDGQLPPADAEAAWAHVHQCSACRDLVEREGWIKTQLAGLSMQPSTQVPAHLKGALLGCAHGLTPSPHGDTVTNQSRGRRVAGFAALGGGAAGAAVMGILALGAMPADAPTPSIERRSPTTQGPTPVAGYGNTPAPAPTPIRLTQTRRN